MLDTQGQPAKVRDAADARIDTTNGPLNCSTVDTVTLDPGSSVATAGIFHNHDCPVYHFDLRANVANRIKWYPAANR